jgi:small-conductance mechanosensitive channel/CRP-like cAMP-binding protein
MPTSSPAIHTPTEVRIDASPDRLSRWLAPTLVLAAAWALASGGEHWLATSTSWRLPVLRALQTVAGLAAALLVIRMAGWALWDRLVPRWTGVRAPRLLRQFSATLVMLVAALGLLTQVWQVALATVLAATGVAGLVLGLALRRILTDFFSGIALNIEQPFRLDDFVQLHVRSRREPITGLVREINWRSTRILTPEDNLVSVPNSVVASAVVENLSYPSPVSEQEIDIVLDWSVPAPVLEGVLGAAVTEAWARGAAAGDKPPKVRIARLDGVGVTYRITYLLDPRRKPKGPARHELLTCVHRHLRMAGLRPVSERMGALAAADEAAAEGSSASAQLLRDPASAGARTQALAALDLFASLTAAEREGLAAAMPLVPLEAGQTIVTQGNEGDSMFVIAAGTVEVRMAAAEGASRRVNALGAGAFFGEMSLLTGEPRSATVRALTAAAVYTIDRALLTPLLAQRPELAEALSRVVAMHREHDAAGRNGPAPEAAAATLATRAAALALRIRGIFRLGG